MKRRHLVSLAVLGISVGLVGCQATGSEMSPEMKSFYELLDANAQQKFLKLDDQHKRAAMEIMNQGCEGKSACQGHREQSVEQQYNNQMQQRAQMSQ